MADDLEKLTDEELRKKSLSLRFQVRSGTPLNQLMTEAYAMVREAAHRTLNMRHYEVQLLGGIAMHHGSIAVMQTGEGKTLTATLPIYLAALTGQGAHLATANDYLAARDADLMSPVYQALGMTVGVVESETSRNERRKAYASDITYSTAKEVGFDFLRDRLHLRKLEEGHTSLIASLVGSGKNNDALKPVQRELNFMLVDEADSILIDEARTPLIVSSVPDGQLAAREALYRWSAKVSPQFIPDEHFDQQKDAKSITLTPEGRKFTRKLPQPELLMQIPVMDIYDQLEQAIFVEQHYVRDRQYVVRDGEVVIVDEFTGRLAEGRKWRAGLHQAIEAREDLEISFETGEAARVTIQDLFLKYESLCGMTGTAANSANELRKIYNVRVEKIPTNKPPQRKQWPDLVFGNADQKWHAIADEVHSVHKTGRPVLIGTRSIDKSELLAKLLEERRVPHEILNAKFVAREAEIVAAAGGEGKVTVATNMAGRGTDIKLTEKSNEFGGLHVIISEVHESARIDRQLIGRCGRQGDPGSFRFFMSLEDEILRTGLGDKRADNLSAYLAYPPASLIRYAPIFRKAQQKIEKRYFQARKMLLHQEELRQEVQREMGQDPYLDTPGG
jgi:preprotein translocase subunit SecA